MKPDWKAAPEWANWLAKDITGAWFWFEVKPVLGAAGVWDSFYGRLQPVECPGYKESLEERPS